MADMNKRPNTARSALEDELVGDITDQASQQADTGKANNYEDPYSRREETKYRKLNITQGHRRRHPDRVLQQHKGLSSVLEDANSVWEQAMAHETERVKLPEIYKIPAYQLMSTQVGLEDVADQAFKKSKNKMNNLSTMIGV